MNNIRIEASVLYLYLVKEKSHRYIQKNALGLEAPERGGGFETMKILHKYSIYGEHKGNLKNYDFIKMEENIPGTLYNAAKIIKQYCQF